MFLDTVFIAGQKALLTAANVTLEMRACGRAAFTVQSSSVPSGIIVYQISNDGEHFYNAFFGHITSAQRIGNNLYRILAREISAILERPHFLALRNTSFSNVIAALSAKTALAIDFSDPNIVIPHFFSLGSGIYTLDSLAEIAAFPKPFYAMRNTVELFFGDYEASPFNVCLQLPQQLFSDISSVSASIATISTLRAGHRIKIPDGQELFIERLEIARATSRLYFSHNPWEIV